MHVPVREDAPGRTALVGPGRAGTTVIAALAARGWTVVGVAGRSADAASTRAAAERFGAEARAVADVGRGASLVVVATPDAAIAGAAATLAPSVEPGALVVHLSGACAVDELDKLHLARPDIEVGSLHPLQSIPSVDVGLTRLPGSWCAIDGPTDRVLGRLEHLALTLGMRPFRVDPERRASYHAAATVASNHIVALLAQAQRVARDAGVPAEAFLPLVRATVDNVDALGARAALTGPVARGDLHTIARHLEGLPADERDAYRALARAALALSGRDDPELARLLTLDVDAGHEASR